MPLDQIEPIDGAALDGYVERVAALMTRQKELAGNIAEVCAEGDEAGVATKRDIRRLAKESLMEPDVLQSQLRRMEQLRAALADYASTPLGAAAVVAQTPRNPQPAEWPRPFAEQPLRRRGRPRKVLFDRDHPDGFPPVA